MNNKNKNRVQTEYCFTPSSRSLHFAFSEISARFFGATSALCCASTRANSATPPLWKYYWCHPERSEGSHFLSCWAKRNISRNPKSSRFFGLRPQNDICSNTFPQSRRISRDPSAKASGWQITVILRERSDRRISFYLWDLSLTLKMTDYIWDLCLHRRWAVQGRMPTTLALKMTETLALSHREREICCHFCFRISPLFPSPCGRRWPKDEVNFHPHPSPSPRGRGAIKLF